MDTLDKLLVPIIGFVATVAFGFWLGKMGRPYIGLLFNVHKLIALGVVIVTSMRVYEAFKSAPVQALVIGLVVVAGLAVVALFLSGAFLSIGSVDHRAAKTVHNIALVVAVLAMGLVIHQLAGRDL